MSVTLLSGQWGSGSHAAGIKGIKFHYHYHQVSSAKAPSQEQVVPEPRNQGREESLRCSDGCIFQSLSASSKNNNNCCHYLELTTGYRLYNSYFRGLSEATGPSCSLQPGWRDFFSLLPEIGKKKNHWNPKDKKTKSQGWKPCKWSQHQAVFWVPLSLGENLERITLDWLFPPGLCLDFQEPSGLYCLWGHPVNVPNE